MEVFKWCPLRSPEPQVEYAERVKEIQFGDGYEQIMPDGINSQYRLFKNFTYSDKANEVLDFYKKHGRSKRFILDVNGHKAVVRFSGNLVVTESGLGQKRVTVEMKEVF